MQDDNKKEVWWKPAVQIFGEVSVWVVVPIVLALIIGKYLDARFGTSHWIFLGLSGVGFLISSFGIVRTVQGYMRKLEKEEKEKNGRNKINSK